MPGCGKTTIGEELSNLIGYEFYDCDLYVEQLAGKTIPALFSESEELFRNWETQACMALSKKQKAIISTGGGVIKKAENIQILKATGTLFFIDRPVNHIQQNVDVTTRPLLANDPLKLYDLYLERYPLYKQYADHVIPNAGDLSTVLLTIKEVLSHAND